MIRFTLAAGTLALLVAGCSKGPEDLTARYAMGGQSGALTVKAAANGDARVDVMGATMIRHDGVEYMVGHDPEGSFAAKLEDFTGAIADTLRAQGLKPPPSSPQPEFVLNKEGTETIAGRTGDVWTVTAKQKPGVKAADAVIDPDPAYAHLGRALAMQAHLGAAGLEASGSESALEKRLEELLDKGLMLRLGTEMKLEKVEKTAFAEGEFALPKKTLDRAALRERFAALQAKQKAALDKAPVPVPPRQETK